MSSQIAAVSAPFLVAVAIGLGSWRIAFGALAVLALAGTVVFGLAVRRAELPTAGTDDRDLIAGIRAQWHLVAAGVVFVGFTGFVWQGRVQLLRHLPRRRQGHPAGDGQLAADAHLRRRRPVVHRRRPPRRPLLLPSMLLSVLGGFVVTLVAFTMVEGVVAIAAVSVVMGLVVHGLFPVGDAYLLDNLPDENRASAYSGFSATMMLIQAPGSVVGLLAQAG